MAFRTPRRRISPRTRKKYTAFRNFIKRAIGSPSRSDIKIQSNTDISKLKRQVLGLESDESIKKSEEVCCLDNATNETSDLTCTNERMKDLRKISSHCESKVSKVNTSNDTRILYQTNKRLTQSDETNEAEPREDYNKTPHLHYEQEKLINTRSCNKTRQSRPRERLDVRSEYFRTEKQKPKRVKTSQLSSTSYHSLSVITPDYLNNDYRYKKPERNKHRQIRNDPIYEPFRNRYRNREPLICYEDVLNYKSTKSAVNDLDNDYIAKVIKKQYKPVTLFDKRHSNLSQFSAPICKDYDHKLRKIKEDKELYLSDDYAQNSLSFPYNLRLRNMGSVCDTRLYSNKKVCFNKQRRKYTDIYNDANLYDIIPVKEKSTPKSRRKFERDNYLNYYTYRAIPPSPRTHRPKLNLDPQYIPDEDVYVRQLKSNRRSRKKYKQFILNSQSDSESQIDEDNDSIKRQLKVRKAMRVSRPNMNPEDIYSPHFQSPTTKTNYINTLHSNHIKANVCNENVATGVTTDNALSEIKDLLQNFLHEIKKETSNFDNKSDISTCKKGCSERKSCNNNINEDTTHQSLPPSDFSRNIPPCFPPFNPCCYPLLPIYPMNCMQNPYVSNSMTCPMCVDTSNNNSDNRLNKSTCNKSNECEKEYTSDKNNTLTEEMIKEIYKRLMLKPERPQYSPRYQKQSINESNIKNSHHAAGIYDQHVSKHDAQVGTPKLKCYSKSCEAFGSKIMSETYVTKTQGTVSDTILEKRSIDASITHTSSDSTLSSDDSETTIVKKKLNKFTNIMRRLGLMKKEKNDIVDLKESDKTLHNNKRNPFKQHITNYTMHGQEFYNEPPVPGNRKEMPGYSCGNRVPTDHRNHLCKSPIDFCYDPRYFDNRFGPVDRRYLPPMNTYDHTHYPGAQGPLCLKEIEVTSTATQSDDKNNKSFFANWRKRGQNIKTQNLAYDQLQNISTQTKGVEGKHSPFSSWQRPSPWGKVQSKPSPFSWKGGQEKSTPFSWKNWTQNDIDPLKYSYEAQKKLAEGDMKMRNGLFKKLLNKRNPFSPGNVLMKSFLGNDKPGFGQPSVFRPKMFF